MDDRGSRLLTGISTAFCCCYLAWLSHGLGLWLRAFARLFDGLAGPLPSVSAFVLGIPSTALLVAGALLIAGLVAKEFLVKNPSARTTITFLVFMAVTWFAFFCLGAVVSLMKEVLDKIG